MTPDTYPSNSQSDIYISNPGRQIAWMHLLFSVSIIRTIQLSFNKQSLTDQRQKHKASTSPSWWCVCILCTVFSVCRGSTHYSMLSQGQTCVNAFSPVTLFFSPPSAPSCCFSADSGLWQSYLPFNPDQSPAYLQLLNHKHFIGSALTLTDMGWWGFGIKCL